MRLVRSAILASTVGLAVYAGVMFCAVWASTWVGAQYCGDGLVQDTYEYCGDNKVDNGETCDTWVNNGSVCTPVYGGWCSYCSDTCERVLVTWPSCGDGKTDANESCDDGNKINDDWCNNLCKTTFCGDGAIQVGEACDAWSSNGVSCNPINGGSCSFCTDTCTQETIVGPRCGDGKTDAWESCDDGNTNNNDGCNNSCKTTFCGDGITQAWESCDNGNNNGNVCTPGNGGTCSYCSSTCENIDVVGPRCGDGIVTTWEMCDDGNTNNNDGCTNTCKETFCGDSVVQAWESCDKWSANGQVCIPWVWGSCTYCSATCSSKTIQWAMCGNGDIESWEFCDDGNTTNWDGCSSTCLKEPKILLDTWAGVPPVVAPVPPVAVTFGGEAVTLPAFLPTTGVVPAQTRWVELNNY